MIETHAQSVVEIKKIIIKNVYLVKPNETINWIFDFRRVTLTPVFLNLYVKIFFSIFEERYKNGEKFQVCGLESASIALISAVVLESHKRGLDINGFFMRKGKKKHDLHNDIEGVPNGLPVIVLDDILNTGSTLKKQIEILKREKIEISNSFSILRYRDLTFYDFALNENIKILSIFELNDFETETGLVNKKSSAELQPLAFDTIWSKKYAVANFKHVVRKSNLLFDEDRLFFGTDEGIFFCLNSENGDIVWQKKINVFKGGKGIFSSPKIYKEKVFFGAYDGNFYCLNKFTGKSIWTFMDADWVGSSPCISYKHKLVYVGLEYGLFAKRGSVVAIDIETGKEVWQDFHNDFTHCSPYVSEQNNLLFCGSNDGILRIYNAKTGELKKSLEIGAEIKDCFSENDSRTKVAFVSFAKKVHVVNTKTLEMEYEYETYEVNYSTPVWYGEDIIVSSLDKRIYRLDTKNKIKKWEFLTSSRVFADPIIVSNKVFVGNNAGTLYRINIETGQQEGYVQFAERIVNKIVYVKDKKIIYVPTLAHEVYCINGDFLL